MLVLTRKLGQTIVIGDDITVTVVGVRGEKIRLGITAPKGVSIHRSEVAEAIAAVKHQSAGAQHGEAAT